MSVHYKFKSSLDIDTITFDGLHISVGDLKKAIINQKRKGHVWKATDFDLQVINAQTKEEYNENNILIPKNTSLIIARVPLTNQSKAQWNSDTSHSLDKTHSVGNSNSEGIRGELDLSQMSGTEEDKIQAMMSQSTMDYDPNKYQKIRGQGQVGEVPISYRCFKCHKSGHWIKNCPLNSSIDVHTDHKRVSGIPKSFLQDRGNSTNNEKTETTTLPDVQEKEDIPDDLICSICKDLFSDAVMIPCCGSSFCDECVRTALLESEDNECPDCKEKGCSPGSLIPNRFLRNSVNNFKNRTGYVKYQQNVKEVNKVNSISKETVDRSSEKGKTETKVSNEQIILASETTIAKKDKPIEEKVQEEKNKNIKETSPQYSDPKEKEPDSDYEDNITVTISPRNKENSSIKSIQLEKKSAEEVHSSRSPSNEIKQVETLETFQQQSFEANGPIQQIQSTNNIVINNMMQTTGYIKPMPESIGHSQPRHAMVPGHYEMNNYNRMPHLRGYMYNERRPPHPGSYPSMHGRQMNMGGPNHGPRYLGPSSNFMSVYQGVANKVGTGIIDDPLEAFNRIMREKEKRKEKERRRSVERHRSIERHRSRSNERRFQPNRKNSPFGKRLGRNRTPDFKKDRERQISRERERRAHHYREPERDRERDRDRDRDREKERDRERDRDRDRDRERDRERERDRRIDYRDGKQIEDYNRDRDRDKRPLDEFYDRRDDFRDRKVEDYRKDRMDEKRRRRSRSNSFSDRSIRNSPEKRFERSSVNRFEGRLRQSPSRFSPLHTSRHSPMHLRHSPGQPRHSPLHMRHSPGTGLRISPLGHGRISPGHSRNSPSHLRHSPPPHARHSPLPYARHSPPSHYHAKEILQRYEEAPPGTIDPPPPGFEFSSKSNYIWSPNEFNNQSKTGKKEFYGEDPFDMYFPPKEQFDDESEAIYGDLNNKNDHQYEENKYEKNRSRGRSHSNESSKFKDNSHSNFRKRSRTRSPSSLKNNKNDREELHHTSQNSNNNKNKSKHNIEKEKFELNSKHSKHQQQFDENRRESADRHSPHLLQNSIKEFKDDEKSRKSSEKSNKVKLSKFEKHSDTESGKKSKKLKKESRKKKKEEKERDKDKDKDKKHRKKNKDKKEKIKLQKMSIKEISKTNTPPKTSEDEIDLKSNADQDQCVTSIEEEKNSPKENVTNEHEDDKKSHCSSNAHTDESDEQFANVICENDFDLNTSAESGEIIEDNFDSSFQTNNITPLPEPSKWELEDEVVQYSNDKEQRDRDDKNEIQSHSDFNTKAMGKVTSEVIKRAENAIFTRTTSAIRPIEVKKNNLVSEFDPSFDKKECSIKSFTIKHKSIKDRLGPLINPHNLLSSTAPSTPTVIASSFDRGNVNKIYDLDENSTNKNSSNNRNRESGSNKSTRDSKNFENNSANRSTSRDKERESRHRENRLKSRSRSKEKINQSASLTRRNSFERRDFKEVKSTLSTSNNNFNKDKKRGRSPTPSTDDMKTSKKSKQDRRHRSRSQRKHSILSRTKVSNRKNRDSSSANSSSDSDDNRNQSKRLKHKYDKEKKDTSRRSSSVDSRKSSKSKKKKKKSSKKKKKSKD